jgi:hypothetical protein
MNYECSQFVAADFRMIDGTPGSSTLQKPPNICYADTGTFMVKLIAANTAGSDTIIKQLYIQVLPGIKKKNYIVSDNTILCPDDTLHLEMKASGLTYIWNNGSSDSVYTISEPGIYWADLINRYDCKYRDSMVIKSQTIPGFMYPVIAAAHQIRSLL